MNSSGSPPRRIKNVRNALEIITAATWPWARADATSKKRQKNAAMNSWLSLLQRRPGPPAGWHSRPASRRTRRIKNVQNASVSQKIMQPPPGPAWLGGPPSQDSSPRRIKNVRSASENAAASQAGPASGPELTCCDEFVVVADDAAAAAA